MSSKRKSIDEIAILEYIKTLNILCIECNTHSLDVYNSTLDDLVNETIFANNCMVGLEKYNNNDIHVVMVDYDLSSAHQLKTISKIRELDKELPIVVVSDIDDINFISKALALGVNNFLKKPVQKQDVIDSLKHASKLLIANKLLKEKKSKKLQELQDKESYNSYQEDLGFAKELNILRNDFYYKMICSDEISLLDFMYNPLDVMSGDAYSARYIDDNSTFYLMVDGMGKGMSASLSAMIITSFVNHLVDKMISHDSFDLGILVNESMEYIQPVLLEEEALAIDYIVIDNEHQLLYYAKFAMPTLLMENAQKKIEKIRSNNPPLCKYQNTFNISSYDISNISKFLIYSDGMVENKTIIDEKLYAEFIEEDFLNSFTKSDLKKSFFDKISTQDDDVTVIYINNLKFKNENSNKKVFSSSLDSIDIANEWYGEMLEKISTNKDFIYNAGLVFTELFMNAYEHGNLDINHSFKQTLLEEDIYFETLIEKSESCDKEIVVTTTEVKLKSETYFITQITDEGEGFDTQILAEIFRNTQTFNGRGVFVSRKNSLGIYYNNKGNSVLYLNKI